MQVDEAGRHDQAARVQDLFGRVAPDPTDPSDAPVLQRDVVAVGWSAGPVDDGSTSKDRIEVRHGTSCRVC